MEYTCVYKDYALTNNTVCMDCSMFLSARNPIVVTSDGYAVGECDRYMCDGCDQSNCIYKSVINL